MKYQLAQLKYLPTYNSKYYPKMDESLNEIIDENIDKCLAKRIAGLEASIRELGENHAQYLQKYLAITHKWREEQRKNDEALVFIMEDLKNFLINVYEPRKKDIFAEREENLDKLIFVNERTLDLFKKKEKEQTSQKKEINYKSFLQQSYIDDYFLKNGKELFSVDGLEAYKSYMNDHPELLLIDPKTKPRYLKGKLRSKQRLVREEKYEAAMYKENQIYLNKRKKKNPMKKSEFSFYFEWLLNRVGKPGGLMKYFGLSMANESTAHAIIMNKILSNYDETDVRLRTLFYDFLKLQAEGDGTFDDFIKKEKKNETKQEKAIRERENRILKKGLSKITKLPFDLHRQTKHFTSPDFDFVKGEFKEDYEYEKIKEYGNYDGIWYKLSEPELPINHGPGGQFSFLKDVLDVKNAKVFSLNDDINVAQEAIGVRELGNRNVYPSYNNKVHPNAGYLPFLYQCYFNLDQDQKFQEVGNFRRIRNYARFAKFYKDKQNKRKEYITRPAYNSFRVFFNRIINNNIEKSGVLRTISNKLI